MALSPGWVALLPGHDAASAPHEAEDNQQSPTPAGAPAAGPRPTGAQSGSHVAPVSEPTELGPYYGPYPNRISPYLLTTHLEVYYIVTRDYLT